MSERVWWIIRKEIDDRKLGWSREDQCFKNLEYGTLFHSKKEAEKEMYEIRKSPRLVEGAYIFFVEDWR